MKEKEFKLWSSLFFGLGVLHGLIYDEGYIYRYLVLLITYGVILLFYRYVRKVVVKNNFNTLEDYVREFVGPLAGGFAFYLTLAIFVFWC